MGSAGAMVLAGSRGGLSKGHVQPRAVLQGRGGCAAGWAAELAVAAAGGGAEAQGGTAGGAGAARGAGSKEG